MPENPLPSAAFDKLVAEEIATLGALLAQSGKSIAIVVVASSGVMAETYSRFITLPADRVGIMQGMRAETRDLAERWA